MLSCLEDVDSVARPFSRSGGELAAFAVITLTANFSYATLSAYHLFSPSHFQVSRLPLGAGAVRKMEKNRGTDVKEFTCGSAPTV